MLQIIDSFLQDPWFSSLWESGELVRLPHRNPAALHARRARQLKEGPSALGLVERVESSGLDSLFSLNPMAVFTNARYRTTSHEVDRIYGIMQIFGDEFKVGNAGATPHPDHQYTLDDLQDELGALLLHRYPILSQLHTHLDPPPVGKGWRVCTRSDALNSHFSDNFRIHDANPTKIQVGRTVSKCQLSTRVNRLITWGYFTGTMCPLSLLQQSWDRNFYSPLNAGRIWGRKDGGTGFSPMKMSLSKMNS